MAKKMGSDGVPVDVPTVPPKGGANQGGNVPNNPPIAGGSFGGDDPTAPPPGKGAMNNVPPQNQGQAGSSSMFPDDLPTVPPGGSNARAGGDPAPAPAGEVDNSQDDPYAEPKTEIAGGRHRKNSAAQDSAASADSQAAGSTSQNDAMSDPVAGWLVVVKGPGMGQVMQIGHGQNTIGRESSQRIQVDFGDDQVSRQNHAMITYDPRGRQFYLSQGTGSNLAYLNDAPVLAPTALESHCEITLGETVLRFVPFCSQDFSWDDVEE